MPGIFGRNTLVGMRGHPGTAGMAGSPLVSPRGVFPYLEDLAAVTGRAIPLRVQADGGRPCRLATAEVLEAVGSHETLPETLRGTAGTLGMDMRGGRGKAGIGGGRRIHETPESTNSIARGSR